MSITSEFLATYSLSREKTSSAGSFFSVLPKPMVCMPKALARMATSLPMPPYPIIPIVCPYIDSDNILLYFPFLIAVLDSQIFLYLASINAIACSATGIDHASALLDITILLSIFVKSRWFTPAEILCINTVFLPGSGFPANTTISASSENPLTILQPVFSSIIFRKSSGISSPANLT